jgi:hypothetical protein
VSLVSGEIELLNMQLKTSIFNDGPLPFQLEAGQVGRIYMKIPFLDMFKSPLVIEINDVFGLVRSKTDWDEEKEKEYYQDYVQSVLSKFELFVKQQFELKKEKEKIKQADTYSSTLITRIVDNIKVKVGKIYFRYEDSINNKVTK